MITGHGWAGDGRGAKWKACCWVTVSGGSSNSAPRSGPAHAPAAMTTTGAVSVPPGVWTRADEPSADAVSLSTGVSNRTRVPCLVARRSIAVIADSGSSTPASW
jgi:hypothetical protein